MSKYKCGSGWNEWIVPDKPIWLWFLNFQPCCEAHDKAYERGGYTPEDRLQDDIDFHQCIIQQGQRSWFYRFATYKYRVDKTADMYFNAVRKYGAEHYNWREDESHTEAV